VRPRRKPQTLTWIEINEGGGIAVSALPAADFATPLPEDSPPTTLGEGAFQLYAEDGPARRIVACMIDADFVFWIAMRRLWGISWR
jgi:hypothetical protein